MWFFKGSENIVFRFFFSGNKVFLAKNLYDGYKNKILEWCIGISFNKDDDICPPILLLINFKHHIFPVAVKCFLCILH